MALYYSALSPRIQDDLDCDQIQAAPFLSASGLYEIKRSASPLTSLATRSPWLYKESALRNTDADVTLSIPDSPPDSMSPKFVSSPACGAFVLPPFHTPACHNVKTITMLSPSTPLQGLFASSPGAFWQPSDFSVSPIAHTSSPYNSQSTTTDDSCDGKIPSLEDYQKAQDSMSPISRDSVMLSSPSSLSSLSSVPSSPASVCSPVRPRTTSIPSHQRLRLLISRRRIATSERSPQLMPPFDIAPTGSQITSPSAEASSGYFKRSRRQLPSSLRNNTLSMSSDLDLPASPCSSRAGPRRAVGRKRIAEDDHNTHGRKRARFDQHSASEEDHTDEAKVTVPNRTFPLRIPLHQGFPLFYRRFAVSSITGEELHPVVAGQKMTDGSYNAPRDSFDLYTPRFVKGVGATKVGLCPICCEGKERGGDGKRMWLSTKFSAFKCYHMQYAHGISAMTGRPFSPPVAFKTIQRDRVGKHEKTNLLQGKCHKCAKWVPVEGIKDVPSKVPEIHW
ncbi:hypothetical protein CERSUDRAFT_96045 [Gelatoporia subvermispora B]|uniref:Transcription regulator Rua1 C-terminal domain-containing protein n=1 Tax=Ceriporiopsis subvermispora (strain B) TaxID=914234 RepID=M2QUS1_CERS8|nr:hypothetical protein CERSUDRAFT_96045 [Gelatoporia subvermispora B]